MDANVKLSARERCAYGMGNFGNALVYTIIGTYLVFYYTDIIGLNGAVIGSILLVSKIFDGITDLIMGRIVDMTKSKYGKGRVWILRTALPYAVSTVLLFAVPQNTTETFKYIFVFISYNVVSSIFYTMLTVPYNSLGCLMTADSHERNLLGIFQFGFSVMSGILLNMFILRMVDFFGNTPSAWTKSLIVFALIGFVSHMLCFLGTKERVIETKEEAEKTDLKTGVQALFKNKYWVLFLITDLILWLNSNMTNASAVYYAKGVLNNTGAVELLLNSMQVVLIVFLVLTNTVERKLGKGKTFSLGCAITALGHVIMAVGPTSIPVLTVGLLVSGAGSGFVCGCVFGIIGDTIDYSEWKFGVRVTGIGNAALSFAQKVASGLSSLIVGAAISACGYDGNATIQTPEAISMLKALFIYSSILMSSVMIILMLRYDLDKKMNQITKDLEERHHV